jgi:biotin transporter BioY
MGIFTRNFKNRDGSWNIIRILLLTGIIAYFILVRILEIDLGRWDINKMQMNIYVPWGFIAIFISLYIFREYNRVKKAKRDQRREDMNERRQELLDNLFKSKKKDEE